MILTCHADLKAGHTVVMQENVEYWLGQYLNQQRLIAEKKRQNYYHVPIAELQD